MFSLVLSKAIPLMLVATATSIQSFPWPDEPGRALILQEASKHYVPLSIKGDVDRVPAALLDLGRRLGIEKDITEILVYQGTSQAIQRIEASLGSRGLAVTGTEYLSQSGEHWDVGDIDTPDASLLQKLIEHRGVLNFKWSKEPVGKIRAIKTDHRHLAQKLDQMALTTIQKKLVVAIGHLREAAPVESELISNEQLMFAVWNDFAEPTRRALLLLAAHGRSLPRNMEGPLNIQAELQLLEHLGLLLRFGDTVEVDSIWTTWVRANHLDRLTATHKQLADAFAAQIPTIEPWRAGLTTLEAHRHFLAAGEDRRGMALAFFTANHLNQRAKSLARAENTRNDAIRTYEHVLDLDKQLSNGISARARAYASHYLHHTRAHAKQEPIAQTISGYQQAVQDWPGNALFWSRLVTAYFRDGQQTAACQALEQSFQVVENHPKKIWYLRYRGALRLLDPGHGEIKPIAAMILWGKEAPSSGEDASAYEEFSNYLAQGWTSRHLSLPQLPELWFHRETHIALNRKAQHWAATFTDMDVTKQGATPLIALSNAATALREEVTTLRATPSHLLNTEQMERKRLLLGKIDLVASRLVAPICETTWIWGSLEHRNGEAGISSQGHWFAFGGATQDVDPRPRFAQVKANAAGFPIGPILQIEPPASVRSEGELERLWQERFAGRS